MICVRLRIVSKQQTRQEATTKIRFYIARYRQPRERERKKLSHKNIITRVARVSSRRVARSVQHVASAENASSVTTSSAPSWRIADAHSNRATGPGILQLSLSSRANPAIRSGSGIHVFRPRKTRAINGAVWEPWPGDLLLLLLFLLSLYTDATMKRMKSLMT